MRHCFGYAVGANVGDAVRTPIPPAGESISRCGVADVGSEWDALADATGAPPWARPGWTEVWSDCFGANVEAVALRRAGRLRAIAPVIQRRMSGAVAAANVHTPRYVVLGENAGDQGALVDAIVSKEGSFRIPHMEATAANRLRAELAASGHPVSLRTVGASPHIVLASSSWEDYRRTIASRARSIEREMRRLGRRCGPVDVVDVRTPTGLDGYVEIGLELEGSGWKRRDGTAVLSRPDTAGFYRAVCRWAAERGFLRLSFLRAGRHAIAFDLSLEWAGVVSTLKGGYDPRFRSYGPGVMLTYETIRRLFAEGAARYELLGQAEGFKQSFTGAVEQQASLYAATGARGHLGATAHGVRLAARAQLKPFAAPLMSRYRRARYGGCMPERAYEIEI